MKRLYFSIGHACRGLAHAFRNEPNFRIELLCFVAALAGAYFFDISGVKILIILVNGGAVLSAEAFNTAIENLCDVYTKEVHPTIKIIKDVAAGAVFITALIALVCGIIIFLPSIIHLFIK